MNNLISNILLSILLYSYMTTFISSLTNWLLYFIINVKLAIVSKLRMQLKFFMIPELCRYVVK